MSQNSLGRRNTPGNSDVTAPPDWVTPVLNWMDKPWTLLQRNTDSKHDVKGFISEPVGVFITAAHIHCPGIKYHYSMPQQKL